MADNDQPRDWVADLERMYANERRWQDLGYTMKFIAGEKVWVCPTDSQLIENPDVHQYFHQHLATLHVPGPFTVGDEVVDAVGHKDSGTVTEFTMVDGVRHAAVRFWGEVPVGDLAPSTGRETVWDGIEDLDRTIHRMTSSDYDY